MTDVGSSSAHAIVVLGGGVDDEGILTQISQTRVDRAVEIYRAGVAPRIIFAGRCGLTQLDPPITEAAAMAVRAVQAGVPPNAVLLEDESRDTVGNAYFTRALYLDLYGWTRIRIVTSDFHLSRAAWVFRKVLGSQYDFSFVSAASGLSPREAIFRALEECKIAIFLNEWLEALEEGDSAAVEHLMEREHPGYSDAPALSHDDMRRRLEEIAYINRIAGSQRWVATRRAEPRGGGRRATDVDQPPPPPTKVIAGE